MLALRFQVGSYCLALDVRRVVEVVPRVRLVHTPNPPHWLAGTLVYRGKVVPVVDLHRLVGAGECPRHLSSRIILVLDPRSDSGALLGLLAAEVVNVREIPLPPTVTDHINELNGSILGPVVVEGTAIIHLLQIERVLLESAQGLLLPVGMEQPA